MKAKPNPIARILCPILILVSVCMIFLPWLSISMYGYTESMSFFDLYRQAAEYFTEDGEALVTFIAGSLLILLGILGIILSALGKKVGSVLYFVVSLLVVVGALLVINDQVGDYLSYLGLSLFSIVGIGAWLCILLALAAMILALALKGQPAMPARPMGYAPAGYVPMQQPRAAAPVNRAPAAAPAAPGWKCPKCGTNLTANQKFCLNCGTKKPEAPAAPVNRAPAAAPAAPGWKCPKCGTNLTANQKFCLNCGTKKPEAPAAPVNRAPAASPAAPVNRAPAAAPAPMNRAPAPVQQARPAVSGWRCPGCGAALRAEQNFCPKCGTKKPEMKLDFPAAAAPAPAVKPEVPTAPKAPAPAAEEPKVLEPVLEEPVITVTPIEPAHAAPEPKTEEDDVRIDLLDSETEHTPKH